MIVFLTEEESMKVTLDTLIRKNWPQKTEGVDWIVLAFQGKSDLEKNIPMKMKSWCYGSPHFVILRDQDGTNCKAVKKKLVRIAQNSGRPFNVRVVCNELESWFLGDLNAIEHAFPKSKASKLKSMAKFRNPDLLTNASDELAKVSKSFGKVGRASAIAKHFSPAKCVSRSFQVLWQTVTSHLA